MSERARLAWRCRRGRREWDLLLLEWLERHFESTTAAQRARFEAVLELPDPELEHYLLQASHPLQADLPDPGAWREPFDRPERQTTDTIR